MLFVLKKLANGHSTVLEANQSHFVPLQIEKTANHFFPQAGSKLSLQKAGPASMVSGGHVWKQLSVPVV